ncbi:HD domain-containing protein [Anaerocolumna sp.]|uniref:HD domain-containing protein n=1 Tax=Anaerocolumna sp. TaxID=2041569 RepID=UPI0028AE74E3|nr:HD domain-containing protein [Anaerocolumna sp.]
MNRIEKLREHIDKIIELITDTEQRRCAYIHLYGVAQACGLLAMKRGENPELAMMAGMLHDLYSYSQLDSIEHAHKGAVFARKILEELQITNQYETDIICEAIYNHSDKENIHTSFNELLKDADVLQHFLNNPTLKVANHELPRVEKIEKELRIQN